MADRKGWSKLSASYRGRLERQGITRESYTRGADLRGARGHRPSAPSQAAPREITERVIGGEGSFGEDDSDFERLSDWRDSGPGWLPRDDSVLSDASAAALSQLPPPSQWGDVHFEARGNDEPWTMSVEGKGGSYGWSVDIPGGSDARDVLHLLSDPAWFDMDDLDLWEGWADQYDFEVGSG